MPPVTPAPVPAGTTNQLLTIAWDSANWTLTLSVSAWLLAGVTVLSCMVLLYKWWFGGFSFKNFEIDQAEIGVGNNKFRFKPNLTDKQVAYAIWVELSTRKIGLPIDFDHDVIVEVYDSWYNFFSVTRDLVKGVPVNQVKRDSTQAIIKLSIEVLNEGLRPHLTRWQARFRQWYERELAKHDEGEDGVVLDPQEVQAKFPKYEQLKADMLRVNEALIRYRRKMHELVLKD
jgi:hypothetical protein